MKLRHDFVTNSSSSGFIVAFPKRIKTLDEMLDYVGPRWKAERVLRDCLKQEPLDLKDPNFDLDFDPALRTITRTFMSWLEQGWSESMSKLSKEFDEVWYSLSKEDRQKIGRFDEIRDYVATEHGFKNHKDYKKSILEQEANELIKQFKGNYIYYFVYSDESGESDLEHGNTFGSVPHRQISHH